MKEIKISRNPYEAKVKLYKKSTINFKPGLTVLVGCNGCGKSSLIKEISYYLKDISTPFFIYDNEKNDRARAISKAICYGDASCSATLMSSSEGEVILVNMGNCAKEIGKFTKENCNEKEIWILLDAIDSGLSIDNIIDMKRYLFETIIKYNPDKDVYIIVSSNTYEMCNGENCFDIYNGKYIQFNNYDEYKQFILESKDIKDKRYDDDSSDNKN